MNKASYYKRHVFLCTHRREGERGCSRYGAEQALAHCKKRVAQLARSGSRETRVSSSGCMTRCELGPTLVIYPEGIWYSYASLEDIDEIVEQHLVHGEIVGRLTL
mgnify:CR=1 FL=1